MTSESEKLSALMDEVAAAISKENGVTIGKDDPIMMLITAQKIMIDSLKQELATAHAKHEHALNETTEKQVQTLNKSIQKTFAEQKNWLIAEVNKASDDVASAAVTSIKTTVESNNADIKHNIIQLKRTALIAIIASGTALVASFISAVF